MKERGTEQVCVKIPTGLIDLIEQDIDDTFEFRNRSEYIVAAVRYYAEHRKSIKSSANENTSGGGGKN
jgi:Arc/MetJ-type ribon-helix-helix transcriptional regulator